MPLKPCRECGKEVSTESAACPSCGTASPAREISKDFMPCPHCHSVKTNHIGKGAIGFVCLILAGCLIWIPVIGWVAAPILFVVGVVYCLGAFFPSGSLSFHCKDCKQWFKVRKADLLSVFLILIVTAGCKTSESPTAPAVEQPPPPTTTTPSAHPVLGVVVAPESRDAPYDRDDYDYPASIEQRIIDNQGGHFSPYTLVCFDDLGQTDIEHVVAAAEAHDSGMGTRSDDEKRTFARDLANLTTASPSVNRFQKSDNDPAEWLPENNRCWYVGVWVEVKRKYSLTMDQAEVDAILPIYQNCASFAIAVPPCAGN